MTSESDPIHADPVASVSFSNALSPELMSTPSEAPAPTDDGPTTLHNSSDPPMAESSIDGSVEKEEVDGTPRVWQEGEEIEGEAANVVTHSLTEENEAEREDGRKQESHSSPNDLPPNPSPSTTVITSGSARHSQAVEEERVEEKDITDWDPLQRGLDPEKAEEDVAAPGVMEDNGSDDVVGPSFPDTSARPSPTVSSRPSHLQLDLKASATSQPWELVDPPTASEHRRDPEFYSTIESRKLQTLQNTSRDQRIPKSSYYFGPPPLGSAYGTNPVGRIGVHHPREILRIERDYTGGELIQFAPIYPLELEGRITPTQFLESINAINELLISAHSLRHSFFDNMLTVLTLQLSKLITTSHYEKEMQRLQYLFDDLNSGLYNPVGLNLLWPRKVAFLFLEIEYY